MVAASSPSDVFAEQVAAVRGRKGWTQQQLADALVAIGAPIDRGTVAKIESRKRGVSVDELVWFAVALGVQPAALLLPRSADAFVQLAPHPDYVAGTYEAHAWFRGLYPLRSDADDGPRARFFFDEIPDAEVTAERVLPGIHDLYRLASLTLQYAAEPLGRQSLKRVLGFMAADAAALKERVARLEEED
jgi:transcriptional regulator with XRE-family HTH domain